MIKNAFEQNGESCKVTIMSVSKVMVNNSFTIEQA